MELVSVRTFFHHVDADLAKSALDAAGIESVVSADDAGGQWAGTSVRLLVSKDDYSQADAVLCEAIDPPEE